MVSLAGKADMRDLEWEFGRNAYRGYIGDPFTNRLDLLRVRRPSMRIMHSNLRCLHPRDQGLPGTNPRILSRSRPYPIQNFHLHTSGSLPLRVYSSVWHMPVWIDDPKCVYRATLPLRTCVENLDPHLVCFWWCDLDDLDRERLAGTPANRSFALYDLSYGACHYTSCI
jgi:hypothetical protein